MNNKLNKLISLYKKYYYYLGNNNTYKCKKLSRKILLELTNISISEGSILSEIEIISITFIYMFMQLPIK